ncbi:ABC transporter substrate-binding protein [Nocardia sp. NEAU-G5]|uniref:ABC transporter substrate-binding protein n=1 Tax=Nocardia albiluteola TaxID=2842303 RepID=A0ABS6BA60_9NOCA|nr:ABC transporter substrate-binding protein [Nocardia albiluteola]MBU3067187.1 ABC transporter substrate-binding protein [Nocardia albiluteola]
MKRSIVARVVVAATAVGLAVGLTACGSSSDKASNGLPTVTMMVGGIDKQIYLPYQLAEGLGLYKKYGVNMSLSTETTGGVGAEDAMASGQVDMAGAWYIHAAEFQSKGKDVVSVAQLSGAPGEREMCATGSNVHSPADWKGKSVGVTDLGSGTDDLSQYLAAQQHLGTKDYSRVGVGDGSTLISSLKQGRIACAMTTQPTVAAIEKTGVGYSATDLASTAGSQQWLGGVYPAAAVLSRTDWVNSHKDLVQKVVNALVETMHYINTHSAADIAAHLPPKFVSNELVTKDDYIKALDQDKGQFLPDGMMPAGAAQTAIAIDKFVGKLDGSVDVSKTYTDSYVIQANKTVGSGN